MIYTINKQKGTYYVDYIIKNNRLYIIEEYSDRVKTTFICSTDKNKCDNLTETSKTITIEI